MPYFDTFLANLNVVVRISDFLSCGVGDVWADEKAQFEQNKFYCIKKGSCVITIDGKEYYGKKGTCFFIPANKKNGYRNISDAEFEKYWFHFDLYPDSSLFHSLNLDYAIDTKDDTILNLFKELYEKYNSDKLTDKLDVKSLAIRILSEYIAESNKETKVHFTDSEERFSSVISYINQNLGNHISNEELSRICYLHPNHFVRFFKKKTGTTPQNYIMEQRALMAKRLIDQTDMTFSDIATQVGLCDAPHLYKVFKKYFSLNPQEYRKTSYRRRWL